MRLGGFQAVRDIYSAALSPCGRWLATGCEGGLLALYSVNPAAPHRWVPGARAGQGRGPAPAGPLTQLTSAGGGAPPRPLAARRPPHAGPPPKLQGLHFYYAPAATPLLSSLGGSWAEDPRLSALGDTPQDLQWVLEQVMSGEG